MKNLEMNSVRIILSISFLILVVASSFSFDCIIKKLEGFESPFVNNLLSYGLLTEAKDEILCLSGEEKWRTLYSVAIENLRNAHYSEAVALFDAVCDNANDENLKHEAIKLSIVASFLEGDFGKARITLEKYPFETSTNPLLMKINQACLGEWHFEGVPEPRHRSPELARILSFIIPGAGLVYSGRIEQATRSAVANGLFGWVVADGFLRGFYPRSLVIFYMFGSHFWLGGSELSGISVERFNDLERKRASREAMANQLCYE